MRCTRRGRDEGASERRTVGARPWWTTSTQTVRRRPTDPRAPALIIGGPQRGIVGAGHSRFTDHDGNGWWPRQRTMCVLRGTDGDLQTVEVVGLVGENASRNRGAAFPSVNEPGGTLLVMTGRHHPPRPAAPLGRRLRPLRVPRRFITWRCWSSWMMLGCTSASYHGR